MPPPYQFFTDISCLKLLRPVVLANKQNFHHLIPLRRKHNTNRLNNQFEITPGTTIVNVEKVEIYPFIKSDGVPITPGLPIAGNAWFYE